MIANCNRDFGNKYGVGQTAVLLLGTLFGLTNGTCRFLWGYLMDKFGFKTLMYIMSFCETLASVFLYFSVKNDFLYIVVVLLIAICLGGTFAILSPTFTKIFGIDIGPRLFSLSGTLIGVSQFCGPIMTKYILSKKYDYLVAFLIGGTVCVLKMISLLFFDENEKVTVNFED